MTQLLRIIFSIQYSRIAVLIEMFMLHFIGTPDYFLHIFQDFESFAIYIQLILM